MKSVLDRLGWVLAGAATVALVLTLAGVVSAGPLDPPGTPASTDSVRLPGTPITALGTVINQPGHYYLTRNINGDTNGTHGITITTSGVTIDLNGFTMAGVSDSGSGIVAPGALSRITIRNGTVRNWGDLAGNGPGIDLTSDSASLVENITVEGNSGHGLIVGANSVVQNVIAISNDGDGINAVNGNVIRNNQVVANLGDGIEVFALNVLTENRTSLHGGAGDAGYRMVGNQNRASENSSLGDSVGYAVSGTSLNVVYKNWYTGVDPSDIAGGNDVALFAPVGGAANDDPWSNLYSGPP